MHARLSPSPHLLMTADAVGGVWTYALDLVEGLCAAGWRVTLAVCGPAPSPCQRRQAQGVGGLELVELDVPLDWTAADAGALQETAAAVAALARGRDVDLIHLNSPALAALADFDRPVLGVCHSCTASWWREVRGGEPPADFAWRRDLLAQGYAACADLVAPSRAFAAATAELYGVTPQAVWNGRRPPMITPTAPRRPFVLTAGRLWDEGKDLRTLDQAAARLGHPVVALGPVRGPGGAGVDLQAIQAPGPQSAAATADWMARAPVFTSTALYEPFGLAVLEAAQNGAALVLSDIATFRELWEGAAVFAPPRDAEGFAVALDGLLQDEDTRLELAARAQARAARYTSGAMAEAMLDRYARLAETPATREAAA